MGTWRKREIGSRGGKEERKEAAERVEKENIGKKEDFVRFLLMEKLITTSKNAEMSAVTEHWLN